MVFFTKSIIQIVPHDANTIILSSSLDKIHPKYGPDCLQKCLFAALGFFEKEKSVHRCCRINYAYTIDKLQDQIMMSLNHID